MIKLVAGLALTLVFWASPIRGQTPSWPLRVEALTRNLLLVTGPGGNSVALTGPDGVLLLDTQFAGVDSALLSALRRHGAGQIRFVVRLGASETLTDGGSSWGAAGAMVVAHEDLRDRLERAAAAAPGPGLYGPTRAGTVRARGPALAFSEVLALELNGEDLHVVHVGAAHARGDALAHFHRSNVLATGPIFTNDGYPNIDREEGGSIDRLIAAVDRLVGAAGARTRIVPSRGPVTDRTRLLAYRRMLVTVRDRVRRSAEGGASLGQVLGRTPTAEFDERWGRGPVTPRRFVEAVFPGRDLPDSP